MIRVLSAYSVATMRYVSDPVTGIPGRLKWLPTVAEIKAACEEHLEDECRAVQRERDLKAQLSRPLMIEDRRERPTYDELVKRCAAAGLHIGPKKPNGLDVGDFLQRYGVSREAFDATPDLPPDFELKATRPVRDR